MHIFESGEDYLERILMLQNELGNVRAIDIANSMSYSKPSVSVALKKLKANNLIEINNEGNITLTLEGRKKALEVYERHTIITKFLLHIGVNKDVALKDACKIEHDLSNETFEAIKKYINNLK